MLLKRLILIILSIAIGFGLTLGAIYAPFIMDTSLEEYGPYYTFFTTLAFACATGIWLDKFMGTEILPK